MKTGLKNLDKLAYDVVCNWPKSIDFNPAYNGVDYSQIIRFYLWDKVGRALRVKHNIDFEEVAIYKNEFNSFPFYYKPLTAKGKYRKTIFKKEKLIFIPFIVPQFLIKGINKEKKVKIITKEKNKNLSKRNIIKSVNPIYKGNWHLELYNAVIQSLKKYDIEFIPEDKQLLKEQIEGAVHISDVAEQEFIKYKPNALYVHSDNHPPFINYILVAKKLGIPNFTYQHGLDCEHYYLDDCYADYVAVWSSHRKNKYLANSIFKPKQYRVVGNIYVSKPRIKKNTTANRNILFITRPHRPSKCYSPSRNHLEGVKILEAISEFMTQNKDVRLFIKTHPLDYVDHYKNFLKEKYIDDRVTISNKKTEDLISNCSVIVTEDSTAGVEAMCYHLPCVHAHLANSEPTLPLVKYGCALSGRSTIEIVKNLQKAFNLTPNEMKILKTNQKHFIKEFIPLGNSEDLVKFITNNI